VREVSFAVPPEAAGERLDYFLAGLEEVGSRAAAERLLEDRRVVVDGSVRAKSHRLAGGERLELTIPEREASTLEPEELPLRIA
jgi:23S rRNA pseudouridine1911/1915/1917 synthase